MSSRLAVVIPSADQVLNDPVAEEKAVKQAEIRSYKERCLWEIKPLEQLVIRSL